MYFFFFINVDALSLGVNFSSTCYVQFELGHLVLKKAPERTRTIPKDVLQKKLPFVMFSWQIRFK